MKSRNPKIKKAVVKKLADAASVIMKKNGLPVPEAVSQVLKTVTEYLNTAYFLAVCRELGRRGAAAQTRARAHSHHSIYWCISAAEKKLAQQIKEAEEMSSLRHDELLPDP
ncbi:MAG: hypothetical protein HYT28_03540 [Parcubacteria group bacterium]|nr:hypothetical protein [Parcubacteria group bacterium]